MRGALPTGLVVLVLVGLATVALVRARPAFLDRWLRPDPAARDLQSLAAAIGANRLVEGRFTGGFSYAPLTQVTRSGAPRRPDDHRLEGAAAAIRQRASLETGAATTAATAASLHALGVADALRGDHDSAASMLEEAAARDRGNAGLQSDLAVVYLERARLAARLDDLPRGLAATERAIAIDPVKPEALFNRGLALERLSLTRQATAAWDAYLRADASSPWTAEARRRRDALQAAAAPETRLRDLLEVLGRTASPPPDAIDRFASEFPRNAREWIEETALPSWGTAHLNGRGDDEGRWLDVAARTAEALRRGIDDGALPDLTRSIAAARAAGDTKRLQQLATGFVAYGEARALYERDDLKTAGDRFKRAADALAGTQSATWWSARLGLALVVYFEGRLNEAADQLRAMLQEAEARRYVSLQGRIHSILGIIHGSQARFSASLLEYQRALVLYEKTGETDLTAHMHNLIADGLTTLGDPPGAWDHALRALQLHANAWNPRRRYNALLTAMRAARQYGVPDAVGPFHDEIVWLAPHWGPPGALAEAHVERARAEAAAGHVAQAQELLAKGEQLLGSVPASMHWRIETQVLRARVDVLADSRPAEVATEVIVPLEKAIATYRSIGSKIQLAGLHLGLGRGYRQTGRLADAEREFRRGIDLVEEQRGTLVESQLRISHFDRIWDLYDEMIGLELARHDARAAFQFAERSRARTLMDARGWTGPLPAPDEVSAALPAGTSAIYYTVLTDRWVAWVFAPGVAQMIEQPVPRAQLQELADRIRLAAAGDDPARVEAALDAGYDALIRPLKAAIPAGARLYIAADGPLHEVPFTALRDRATRRFVSDDHPVAFVPNARALLDAQVAPTAARPQTLIVGAPLPPGEGLRQLRPLPFARREATAIASLYDAPIVRVGAEATSSAVLSALPQADIVHFAGHAVANPQYPLLSHLVLDRAGDLLFAYQFMDLRLRPGATIVLAACDTASGRMARGEGLLSLARPFVTSGASAVLGSLWELPDEASALLFEEFHRRLRAGLLPEVALREAQRVLRRHSNPAFSAPSVWGGVIAVRAGRIPSAQ